MHMWHIIPDLLLNQAFETMKTALTKHELRYLMKKFSFPEEKSQELESTYHGKDKLQDRVVHAMQFWKEYKGAQATIEELIRILHIVNLEELSQKLKALNIYSQALKL